MEPKARVRKAPRPRRSEGHAEGFSLTPEPNTAGRSDATCVAMCTKRLCCTSCLGRWKEAFAAYERQLQLEPSSHAAANNLGNSARHQINWPLAAKYYRLARTLQPARRTGRGKNERCR